MKKAPSSVLLYNAAEKRGYHPEWLTDYGMFSFTVNGKKHFAYQTKNSGNTQFFTWLTNDKHATHVFLDQYSLPTIPYCYSNDKKIIMQFFRSHHPIIAKPVFGKRSENVILIKNLNNLEGINYSMTIFEQYIPGTEYRYLCLNGAIAAVQQKTLAPEEKHPWKKIYTNLSPEHYDITMKDICLRIQTLVNQKFLAVDFIVDSDNSPKILELNSMPGLWSFLHPDKGKSIDLTEVVLDLIIHT